MTLKEMGEKFDTGENPIILTQEEYVGYLKEIEGCTYAYEMMEERMTGIEKVWYAKNKDKVFFRGVEVKC